MPARLTVWIESPDCQTYPCRDDCCSEGCDVWPHERAALIARGLATADDFSDPYEDDDGDVLHRSALNARGCVFLDRNRGCRLHHTGLKPEVCSLVPRSPNEADEMAAERMLPCRAAWVV